MRQPASPWSDVFSSALARRGSALTSLTTAYRICDGAGDGVRGVYLDRYGPAAVLSVYDDARLSEEEITVAARAALEILQRHDVRAVYVKPFRKDRSRLGGRAPEETTSPQPRAGEPQPEATVVEEHRMKFEVRLWDGFSTGLFLEHREHRRALAGRTPARVLNLFAYTCAFSVPLAVAGAQVTNVDVSTRYLEWGRRNHTLNGIDGAVVRYKRMDAMRFLAYAARRDDERFDLVILDPPTFGAGDPRRGTKPWSAEKDYPALLRAAMKVLMPGGAIFAATNSRTLAQGDELRRMIRASCGPVHWKTLPPWPVDVRERGRVAAALFTLR